MHAGVYTLLSFSASTLRIETVSHVWYGSGDYITLFVCSTLSATQQERIKTVTHIGYVSCMHAGVYITLFSLFLPSAGEDRNSLSCRIWIRRLHYTLFLCLIPPFLPPRRVTHMISTLVMGFYLLPCFYPLPCTTQ